MIVETPIDPLLRDREVARILSCSKSTVWARVKTGDLPQPIKVFGMTRWRASQIAEVVDRASPARRA